MHLLLWWSAYCHTRVCKGFRGGVGPCAEEELNQCATAHGFRILRRV